MARDTRLSAKRLAQHQASAYDYYGDDADRDCACVMRIIITDNARDIILWSLFGTLFSVAGALMLIDRYVLGVETLCRLDGT